MISQLQRVKKKIVTETMAAMNNEELKPKHILHSAISHPLLREWHCSKTEITAQNIMYPVFIS